MHSPSSSSSSPSLDFSDLSPASSATDLHVSNPPCRFVVVPQCKTSDDLVACVKSASFEKDSYLVLVVGSESFGASAASLEDTIHDVDEVLRQGCNVKLDILPRKPCLLTCVEFKGTAMLKRNRGKVCWRHRNFSTHSKRRLERNNRLRVASRLRSSLCVWFRLCP